MDGIVKGVQSLLRGTDRKREAADDAVRIGKAGELL